jgi:hypothetical protein
METRPARLLPLLAASLVAFNPMFLFISASVNNDNLVWLEAVLALFLFVHLVRGPSAYIPREIGERAWHAAALGLLLGLAALTKLSGLVLLPVGGLALALQAVRTRDWRRFLLNGAIVLGVVGLAAGWWYVRNLRLYGEPLGLDMMMNFLVARRDPLTLTTLLAESRSFWFSYWGLFGAFSILAPGWMYVLFTVLAALGLMGLVLGGWRLLSVHGWTGAAHGLLLVFIAATAIGLLRWNLTSFAMQGRLTFTTLAPLAMYVAAGLLGLFPPQARRLVTALLIGGLGGVAAFAGAGVVAAAYLPPRPIDEVQLPADLRPIQARLAPGAELIGYTLDSGERLTPGDSLRVTLYWRASESIPADYSLFLHVLGRGRALVGSLDTWPGGGLRPTSFWKAGEIYPDRYVIKIDSNASAPAALRLEVAMWDDDPARPLPITTLAGDPIPSVIVAAGALDSSRPVEARPSHPVEGLMEGGVQLLGYDLETPAVARQPAALVLYWDTAGPIPADLTAFIHVQDLEGVVVAQADGPPLEGDWPTSLWRPGFPVRDPRSITFPSPGDYRLRVGLYDPLTGIRLPAFRRDGSRWPDDAVELATVRVK